MHSRRLCWTSRRPGRAGGYGSRDHFRGKAAALLPVYRAWAALARSCGPVAIYAQKSRIVFQARVRFAGAVVRSGSIDGSLWLRRKVAHPRLRRVESLDRLGYGLHFRLATPADIDAPLSELVRDAYRVARVPRRARPRHLPS